MPRSNPAGPPPVGHGAGAGPAHTFPRAERIRKRADYVRIQGSGRKIHSPNLLAFVVRPRRNDSAPVSPELPRVGITVSRRVGGAVVRNRVKRLIRESFRLQKQLFPAGFDLVLVAKAEAACASFMQISREVADLAGRIRLMAGMPTAKPATRG